MGKLMLCLNDDITSNYWDYYLNIFDGNVSYKGN